MQANEIPWEGLKWVVGTIIAILAAIGGIFASGKIRELKTGRKFTLQDEINELHESNAGKQIDATLATAENREKRLVRLEDKVDKLQDELNSQMKTNAKLDAENEHLKEQNKRQEAEMILIRAESAARQLRIEHLETEVARLSAIVETLRPPQTQQISGEVSIVEKAK